MCGSTHGGVVAGLDGVEAPAVLLARAMFVDGIHVRLGAIALVLLEAVHLPEPTPKPMHTSSLTFGVCCNDVAQTLRSPPHHTLMPGLGLGLGAFWRVTTVKRCLSRDDFQETTVCQETTVKMTVKTLSR